MRKMVTDFLVEKNDYKLDNVKKSCNFSEKKYVILYLCMKVEVGDKDMYMYQFWVYATHATSALSHSSQLCRRMDVISYVLGIKIP